MTTTKRNIEKPTTTKKYTLTIDMYNVEGWHKFEVILVFKDGEFVICDQVNCDTRLLSQRQIWEYNGIIAECIKEIEEEIKHNKRMLLDPVTPPKVL